MTPFFFEDDDDEDWDEDEAGSELTEATFVSCPYCGQEVELIVDPTGGAQQQYVEDCDVCCQPLSIRVTLDGEGQPFVNVATLDEG